jgi:hypothetical protein
MDFKETGWDGMDCIHLAQDRDQWWTLVNMAIEPRGSIECCKILE